MNVFWLYSKVFQSFEPNIARKCTNVIKVATKVGFTIYLETEND